MEKPFHWTPKKEEAALLLAQDEVGIGEIAERVGFSRQTVDAWRKHPDFQSRIDQNLEAIRKVIRTRGIAVIENRINAYQKRWDAMKRIIAERAASPEMATVPGGQTGLLTHNVKSIGFGENAERVDLYELDAGLLKEMRELELQAARELGQLTEKRDITTAGQPVKVLSGVSMNEI